MPRHAFCLRGCARSSYYPQKIVHTAVCLQALAYGLKKEPGGFSQEESGGPKRSQ